MTHEGNTLVGHCIISHGMRYPKNLGATASSSYILSLCGELCNKILFASRPTKKEKIQENDIYQKCFFGQSHYPQNQHYKSQQVQAMKKRNTKCQI
jgi:hypothetical protein